MAFVNGACRTPVPAILRRLAEKEAQVVGQRGLIVLGDEDIVSIPARDTETASMLGMQGIGRDDTPFDQHGRQELRHNREFILFLPGHLLFEQHARLRVIERQLMHLVLI